MTPLERRYRRLLLGYPMRYRRERGEEIIGTLLELARPGQRYPTPRDAAPLILAGLRTRARGERGLTRATIWPGALRMAVLFLLAYAAALVLAELVIAADRMALNGSLPGRPEVLLLLATVLVGGALVATAASRRSLALPLIVLAALASYWTPQRMGYGGILWVLPLAALLSIPLLVWRAPSTRHPARWLYAALVALIVLPTQLPVVFTEGSWTQILFHNQFEILVAILLVCLLWSMVDARIPFAAGAVMLTYAVPAVLTWAAIGGSDQLLRPALLRDAWVWGVAALVPLAVGSASAARQARL